MQTNRRSNLALAGRKFNRTFTDSYNKLSRLTLKKMGKQKVGILDLKGWSVFISLEMFPSANL